MKVVDLAKEYNTTSEAILDTLKALKLKAKNGNQELNMVVVTVVKSALNKRKKDLPKPEEKKASVEKKKKEETVAKKAIKKKAVKKKSANDKVATKTDKEKPRTVTKKVKKKIVKKVVKKTAKAKDAKEGEKKEVKVVKRTKTKEELKSISKVSKQPLITLKPLSRKRKKASPRDKAEKAAAQAELTNEIQNAQTLEQIANVQKGVDQETDKEETQPKNDWVRDDALPDIEIKLPVTVKDLSVKIQQKPSLILKSLMKRGIFANINQSLDENICGFITQDFGFNLAKIKTQEEQLIDLHEEEKDDPNLFKQRSPVVTFMGHVDHGKTSLLDSIRKSKVADKEHGGITQHMGAYSVSVPKGRITFLDTPGHEAFTSMRSRSAHITDLVVVVIAADEGIMPQTEEAIDHARAANVPIVVALNKIDKENADIDRVKKQLMEKDLNPEDWGGKTVVVGVSAMTGEGVTNLLELILLESEMLELRANYDKLASGIVVEAHLSKGKGAVTTLIVQNGTLKNNDVIVVGPYYGKIRALLDDHGQKVDDAGPSMPVEILGLADVPEAGESFYVVEDERMAKAISERRLEDLKKKKRDSVQKLTLEDLYAQVQEGCIKELNVIIKSDVQGSLEALIDALNKIPSDKVKLKFIHSGVGDINASDVLLANASKAIIIAFHVGIAVRAKEELEKHPVDVREYRIIYDAVDDVRNALEGLLEAKTKKNFISRIEIRQVFNLTKHGKIAGCYVLKGKVIRKSMVDVMREDEVVYSGSIGSLKRFKDDVKEVKEGMECGIAIDGFDKYEEGDILEVYEIEKIAQKL